MFRMQIEGGLFGNVWFLGTSPAGMGSLLHGSCGAGGEGRGRKGCAQFGGKVSLTAHPLDSSSLGFRARLRYQTVELLVLSTTGRQGSPWKLASPRACSKARSYGPVLSAGSWDSEQRRSDHRVRHPGRFNVDGLLLPEY